MAATPHSGGSSTTSAAVAPVAAQPEISSGIWVTGVAGTDLRQVSIDSGHMSWSHDGRRIAAEVGGLIWLLSVEDPRDASTLPAEDEDVRCLDWSSRGELAWVTSQGVLRVSSDERSSSALASGVSASTCRWSPDGSMVALGGSVLTVLDRAGRVVGRRPAEVRLNERTVSWSPDGRFVAAVEAWSEGDGHWAEHIVVIEPRGDWAAVSASPTNGHGRWYGRALALSWSRTKPHLLLESVDGGEVEHLHRIDALSHDGLESIALGCCRDLEELEDGRFVAYAPVNRYRPNTLVVASSDHRTYTTLAEARPPRPDRNPTQECAGAYFFDKRVSPDGRRVAMTAGDRWGPRCT